MDKYIAGVTGDQLEEVIKDFIDYLKLSGLEIVDDETKLEVGEGYIIENYFGSFC